MPQKPLPSKLKDVRQDSEGRLGGGALSNGSVNGRDDREVKKFRGEVKTGPNRESAALRSPSKKLISPYIGTALTINIYSW